MTERPGRQTHWGTALLIAPGAAVVFGASVWWAVDAVPTSAETKTATPPVAVASPAPVHITPPAQVDVAARRQLTHALATRRHDSVRLQRRLASLRAELHRLRTAPVPVYGSNDQGGAYSGASGGTVESSESGGTGGSGNGTPPAVAGPAPAPIAPAPVYVPPPPVVQAPPPPPVQANTGASGAP